MREADFLARVEPQESGCWLWLGERFQSGYGRLRERGRYIRAHRWAYERFIGPIPPGLQVNHTCDTPPCVCPDHLYVGTQHENMADSVARRRHFNAEKTHCPRGHPYQGDNLYRRESSNRDKNPGVNRKCRQCRRIQARILYRKRKIGWGLDHKTANR